MDYIFVSAMLHFLVQRKLISYDIACQWSIHLRERIAAFPSHLQIELPEGEIAYGIPKLHYASHRHFGHSRFSLNFIVGAMRTDGEGIERRWWFIQPIAAATMGMGPGRRQNVLEDQWGYSNWRKTTQLRKSRRLFDLSMRSSILTGMNDLTALLLKKRLVIALEEFLEHQDLFDALSNSIKDRKLVIVWTAKVEAWEKDPSLDDPYEVALSGAFVSRSSNIQRWLIVGCRPIVARDPQGRRRRRIKGECSRGVYPSA